MSVKVEDVEINIEPFEGTSSKTGNKFSCFKLIAGEYECLIFPRGNMERKELERVSKIMGN